MTYWDKIEYAIERKLTGGDWKYVATADSIDSVHEWVRRNADILRSSSPHKLPEYRYRRLTQFASEPMSLPSPTPRTEVRFIDWVREEYGDEYELDKLTTQDIFVDLGVYLDA